ncbi:transposon protein, putative, CACTA, En/Spm sub-class [Panicum miliaceum]|uniref:Transposon protein, putative, CACTA, En/Spm sub-class n=1 Tax=Panicum miliaceum TaxID=4540 RepID=A0A3L6QBS5_PANMI|nr:transposon protein, putative, CACTA, En/Spm sub-class [Panicum miliaceum]
MLWTKLKDMFTFSEGVDEEIVKRCGLRKMALAFSTFKKKLFAKYVKKDKEPNWDDLPQVKPYWEDFKQYKLSEDAQELSEKDKVNASNKKYNHHLGSAGYKKAIRKWQKMEQDHMDRDIQPVTWDWPERSKWWLFANGVTLNQEDGYLVVPQPMEEVARDLVTAIEQAREGTFHPQRENYELTRALKNPEHPGRARSIGVVPWKVTWAGDSSYKTHRKSKAEKDNKIHALQEEMKRTVASLQSEMDARVNAAVQLALSQQRADNCGSQAQADVVISPTSQRRSSCASTAAPDVAPKHPEIQAAVEEHQRYPVDDITIPTACELHVRAKNIFVHVAYGSALPVNPGSTIYGMPIPPGYSTVTVEQIVGNNGDNEKVELNFVGGDVEKRLGHALHGVVLWRKADIKHIGNIAALVDPLPDAINDDRDPSPEPPSPSSPPRQRARITLTPPAPEKGKKKTSSLPLVGPIDKKWKRVGKIIGPQKKLAYEMTDEEMTAEVDHQVKEHFKPKVLEKRVPVDPEVAAKVCACLNNPPAPKKLPSDYDRMLIKAQQKNQKKCGKTVPQLGLQQKVLEPLLVLREEDQQEAEFL